jgi:hypothetical protein
VVENDDSWKTPENQPTIPSTSTLAFLLPQIQHPGHTTNPATRGDWCATQAMAHVSGQLAINSQGFLCNILNHLSHASLKPCDL